jgi:hypothetical protein
MVIHHTPQVQQIIQTSTMVHRHLFREVFDVKFSQTGTFSSQSICSTFNQNGDFSSSTVIGSILNHLVEISQPMPISTPTERNIE